MLQSPKGMTHNFIYRNKGPETNLEEIKRGNQNQLHVKQYQHISHRYTHGNHEKTQIPGKQAKQILQSTYSYSN